MILVIICLITASVLWAITTFLDKHLISNVTKDNDWKGLFVFSTFLSAVIFLPIYFFASGFQLSMNGLSLVIVFGLALCEMGYLVFYMKAMAKEDTSSITALFQFIPVFTYFLGLLFLNETFTLVQIVSGIVVIVSTVAMSIQFQKGKKLNKNKLMALLFMLISSFIIALQTLGFKVSILENNFSTTMFFFQLFLLLLGACSLLLKPFRNAFVDLVKNNGKQVVFFNVMNEVFNVAANALKVFATGFAPIAFVTVFQNGTQIIIAFLLGILLTVLMPKIFDEDISKGNIIKKTICMMIAITATVFFML